VLLLSLICDLLVLLRTSNGEQQVSLRTLIRELQGLLQVLCAHRVNSKMEQK
jgi:hypothetical protein